MKNLIFMLLCGIFASNFANAQYGKVSYSPRIYKEMKTYFYSPTVQKNIKIKHEDRRETAHD